MLEDREGELRKLDQPGEGLQAPQWDERENRTNSDLASSAPGRSSGVGSLF